MEVAKFDVSSKGFSPLGAAHFLLISFAGVGEESSLNERFFATELECWQAIFPFLDYRARLHCEETCKRLRRMIIPLWQSNSHVDTVGLTYGSFGRRSLFSGVRDICVRIGDSLETLVLTPKVLLRSADFLKLARVCARTLTVIDISRCGLDADNYSEVADWRFDVLPNLKSVRLDARCTSSAQLFSIPETLEAFETLRIQPEFPESAAIEFLRRHPRLRDLSIERCDYTLNVCPLDLFFLVAQHAHSVRRLTIAGNCLFSSGIVALNELEQLRLREASSPLSIGEFACVTNEQLRGFCERSPNLRSLLIESPYWLTSLSDVGFRSIARLRRLEELELCGRESNRDDALLEPLFDVDGCGVTIRRLRFESLGITDATIDRIGAFGSERLRVLEISKCRRVSVGALRCLVNAVRAAAKLNAATSTIQVKIDGSCLLAGS